MKLHRKLTVALVATLLAITAAALILVQAQDKSKRPSPPGTAEMILNSKKITIEYSRPSKRGRKIMGGIVPYGEAWRTGANEATSFKTEADLVMGGVAIPKGSYTLYTLPSASGWKLIINKQTGQWGTEYNQNQDLTRVDMKVETLSATVEQFTITLEKAGSGGALKLEWENTRASVNFTEKK